MKELIKTCLLSESHVAEFDAEILRTIECEKAPVQEVEKLHMRIGVRNEKGQIYRLIGISGMGLYGRVLHDIQRSGFTIETQNQAPRGHYDDILMK